MGLIFGTLRRLVQTAFWWLVIGFGAAFVFALIVGCSGGPSPYRMALSDCAREIPEPRRQNMTNVDWAECMREREVAHGGPSEPTNATLQPFTWPTPAARYPMPDGRPRGTLTTGWSTGVGQAGNSRGWTSSGSFGGAQP